MIKILALLFLSFAIFAQARAEGPPWVRVSALSFIKNRKALAVEYGSNLNSKNGPDYYEISNEKTLSPLTQAEYVKTFLSKEIKSTSKISYSNEEPLKSSDGQLIFTERKKCEKQEEGDSICKETYATADGHKFKLDIGEQCRLGCSIRVAEIIDGNLWVSLGMMGELQVYGQGFQVYSLKDFKLIFSYKDIFASVIRKEPSTDNVWIASDKGITIVNLKTNSLTDYYFYNHFNENGMTQIDLANKKTESDPYAVIARDLSISTRDFFEVVKGLPPLPDQGLQPDGADKFVSKKYNSLVPFYLKAVRNKDKNENAFFAAIDYVCNFDDPLVRAYIKELKNNKEAEGAYYLTNCLRKYSEK